MLRKIVIGLPAFFFLGIYLFFKLLNFMLSNFQEKLQLARLPFSTL